MGRNDQLMILHLEYVFVSDLLLQHLFSFSSVVFSREAVVPSCEQRTYSRKSLPVIKTV